MLFALVCFSLMGTHAKEQEDGRRQAQIHIPRTWQARLRVGVVPRDAGQKVPGEFLIDQAVRGPPPWPKRQISPALSTRAGNHQVKDVSETRQKQTSTNNWSFKYFNSVSWRMSFGRHLFPLPRERGETDQNLLSSIAPFLYWVSYYSHGIVVSSSTDCLCNF